MSKTNKTLQELMSLKKEYTQQDHISGRAQISANYTESVLPGSRSFYHVKKLIEHRESIVLSFHS